MSKTLKPNRINSTLLTWLEDDEINFLKLMSLSGHKIKFRSYKRYRIEDDDKHKEFDFLETDPKDVRIAFTIKHPKKKGYYVNLERYESGSGEVYYSLYTVNDIGGYKKNDEIKRKEIISFITNFKSVDFKKISKTIEIKGFVKSCLMQNKITGVASWNDVLTYVAVLYPISIQGTKINKDIAKTDSDIRFLLMGRNKYNSKICIVSDSKSYYFARVSKEQVYVKRVLDKKLTDRDEQLINLAIKLYVEKINR